MSMNRIFHELHPEFNKRLSTPDVPASVDAFGVSHNADYALVAPTISQIIARPLASAR